MTDEAKMAAWRALLFAHAMVLRRLESELLEQHDLPLPWFDVLGRLNAAPDRRMRMRDLEQASLFTRSGMTRLIDRIEASGFVQRERSPSDRRGVYVSLTAEGAEKIEAVWPDHQASVERHFGRHIDKQEAAVLARVGERLREAEAD